jgi:hypothetical protein
VKEGSICTIPGPIDALGVTLQHCPRHHPYGDLEESHGQAGGDVAVAVLSKLMMKGTIITPEVFHFLPATEGDLTTSVTQGVGGDHGVGTGMVSIVEGVYTYHHYMQNMFDDDGLCIQELADHYQLVQAAGVHGD